MIFKNFILIVSLTIFISATCKKKQPPPYVPMTKEFKDYIYFTEGTYWVYRDSSSKAIDSNIVINDTLFYQPISVGVNKKESDVIYYAERFEYQSKSSFTGNSHKYYGGVVSKTAGNNCVCQYAYQDNRTIFFYAFIKNNSTDKIQLINVYDSLYVGNRMYYDVAKFYYSGYFLPDMKQAYYYFSKNFGIIRKEIQDDLNNWQIWNLIRYNIIQ